MPPQRPEQITLSELKLDSDSLPGAAPEIYVEAVVAAEAPTVKLVCNRKRNGGRTSEPATKISARMAICGE